MTVVQSILQKIRAGLGLPTDATEAEIDAALEDNQFSDTLATKMTALEKKVNAFEAAVSEYKQSVEALKADIEALKSRLAVVEKAPVAAATGGDTQPAPREKRSYETSEMTQKGRRAAGYKD